MTLKGYEYLRGERVVMMFTFKRLELDLLTDVTIKEFEEFKQYLLSKNETIHTINQNGYTIKESSKLSF